VSGVGNKQSPYSNSLINILVARTYKHIFSQDTIGEFPAVTPPIHQKKLCLGFRLYRVSKYCVLKIMDLDYQDLLLLHVTHAHTHTRTQAHVHTRINPHTHSHTYTTTSTYKKTKAHRCARVCVREIVCVCVCV